MRLFKGYSITNVALLVNVVIFSFYYPIKDLFIGYLNWQDFTAIHLFILQMCIVLTIVFLSKTIGDKRTQHDNAG
ncbi:hypothetical protein C8N29_10144 [Agitococcus lubricus]|uniref:Uncharacterized protein n=1 Tax=Agitococcus lubricus TaxID=1077255 RepID=A0A2T5J2X9_9GAMM|nr:hypothetical protein C8N29_10144 [Agitococcus lubricus]